jgi:malonyl-CoA O-methyltransferase
MSSIDAYHIDKARVRLSFGRAASSYDNASVLQREVLERMLERLELVALKPNTILDAGCGTGLGGMRLAKRYPQAGLLALDFAEPMICQAQSRLPWLSRLGFGRRHRFICGDMEALPLQDHCVEMAWSNLAVQWCNDLDGAFREFHRVLAPGGLLTFSTFGPDTLKELRYATNVDAAHTHVSRFIDMHDIGDALVRAGFPPR